MPQLIESINQTVDLGTQAYEYINKEVETINQYPNAQNERYLSV